MLKGFANAFRIPELRNKILFTIGILLLYRFGAYLPAPGVPFSGMLNAYRDAASSSGALAVLNLFFVSRTVEDPPNYLALFAKPLAASLVMAVCARGAYALLAARLGAGGLARLLGVGVSMALAVVIYAVLVVALRIVTREDLALLPKGEKLGRLLRIR